MGVYLRSRIQGKEGGPIKICLLSFICKDLVLHSKDGIYSFSVIKTVET